MITRIFSLCLLILYHVSSFGQIDAEIDRLDTESIYQMLPESEVKDTKGV